MSEPTGPISRENLSTVVAVSAVLGVLALSYAIYVHREVQVVAVGAASLDVKAARRTVELESQIHALTERVKALEAAQTPTLTAGAGEGAGAAEAPPADAAAPK